jgi:hypothetical protein
MFGQTNLAKLRYILIWPVTVDAGSSSWPTMINTQVHEIW